MEVNSWPKAEPSTTDGGGGSAGDWRSQLPSEARNRIVNKIMDTLKKHLPVTVPEGLNGLQQIAIRFEDKIYTAAKDQQDYLRRISLKMLSMETKTQNPAGINPSPSNSAVINQNTADSGMQPTLSSIAGVTQSTISNVGVSQISSLQNMPGISQNNVLPSSGMGLAPNIYGNSQTQLQGRQQQPILMSQQQQHQSQNAHLQQQQMYQAYQQQMYKQKIHQQLRPHLQQQQQQMQSSQQQQQMQSSQQQQQMQMSSGTQSGQATFQQTQPSATAPQAGLQQQGQQNLIQQSVPSFMQQHPQSITRQQQVQPNIHQQSSSLQQQSAAVSQQPLLASQQQQQPVGQQPNMANTQTSQLLGQQNNTSDMQQQQQQPRLGQQNNILGIQQPQQMLNKQNVSLHQQQQQGSQSTISGLQQQQLLGTQPNLTTQPLRSMNILQQAKTTQLQHQQPATMLQTQGQQSQYPSSQQLMAQVQSQPAQLQQQLAMQQQSSPLQREMQNRFQPSGVLQSQNAIEQQKQFNPSQRVLQEVSSSTSLDSTAQAGHPGIAEWQEEVYQKIKSLKEAYLPELIDFNNKLTSRIQQFEAQGPAAKQADQFNKMEAYKTVVDRLIQFLQISKNNIQPSIKDKIEAYERQIIQFAINRGRKIAPQQQMQQPFQQGSGHTLSMTQQQSSQVSRVQPHDKHANQIQSMHLQGSGASMQQATASMQHGSVPVSHLGIAPSPQNITNMIQPSSDLDSSQGNDLQGGIGSVQHSLMGSFHNTMNASKQSNINSLPQSSVSTLQSSVGSMQKGSNILQQAHVKQEQQLLQSQQMKHIQQRHMQQQLMQQQQKQHSLQQQPAIHQQLLQQKQQATPLPIHQMSQLNQMNDTNEMKLKQVSGIKSGLYQQHYPSAQRHNFYNQQLKPGSLPISSPQNLQATSPQISQHSSPQVDQHGLLPSHAKVGTPLQASNSPLVVPSPSTPIAPSPIPGEAEKQHAVVSSFASAAMMGHQQSNLAASQNQSLSVGTPGISASPLLAEYTSSDGNHANASTVISGKALATDWPLDRLVKAVHSISARALDSAVRDIGSVVSIIDRVASSAPGNGSRAAVGEDLVAMTKCRLQARNFISQDGSSAAKTMKRQISALPLDSVLSADSMNTGFSQSSDFDLSELEYTATYRIKRQKLEVNHNLLEEIREINQRLIETIVSISCEDDDSVAAVAEGGDGTVVKFTYSAVACSSSLKSQFASPQVSAIVPLRLFVPANYPKCSPVLLDKLQVDLSPDNEDLSLKAKTRFSISLRGLPQPVSLGDMAKTWDVCCHKVISEYAQQMGGGSFSSRYGAWENCASA